MNDSKHIAAPELLAALKAITELHGEQPHVGEDGERSMDVYVQCRFAITKAEERI